MIDSKYIKSVSTIVVPCSARKRELCVSELRARDLAVDSLEVLGGNWLNRLNEATGSPRYLPADLYDGGGFRRARALATEVSVALFIISAGLGLVRETVRIPSYDITLGKDGDASVLTSINGKFDPSAWWQVIQRGPFASTLDSLSLGEGRILVALSRPYALLIGKALSEMPQIFRQRLRILGMGLRQSLPTILHSQLIDYDDRLDIVIPGIKLDAWSRALSHFTDVVANLPMSSVSDDQIAVDASLSHLVAPTPIQRPRVSDEVLMAHIKVLLADGFSATTALKQLRRVNSVACEERRFRRLFEEQVA